MRCEGLWGVCVKSFSVSGFSHGAVDDYRLAEKAVRKNPHALFTDFQWFLYRARNTVYFAAYANVRFDYPQLLELVHDIVGLAPQLTHGFEGAKPGLPLPRALLEAVTDIQAVDAFEDCPDTLIDAGSEIFDRSDLPLFRVRALVRKDGPDRQGRAAMILVRTSHALMEGADSALLSRSLNSGHPPLLGVKTKAPMHRRVTHVLVAALMAPIHLLMAHCLSPPAQDTGFRSLVFDRARIRRLAKQLGVRQRALMFGLVMFAMQGANAPNRKIKTIYTSLDTKRVDTEDDFFRLRSISASFDFDPDLASFINTVDRRIGEVEAVDTSNMQLTLNAMFKVHRFLAGVVPFLYGDRFFRYNGGYDFALTLAPPHRMVGNLTKGMLEPVFCGSCHKGSELCTFVPARNQVTFNFSMRKSRLKNVDKIDISSPQGGQCA